MMRTIGPLSSARYGAITGGIGNVKGTCGMRDGENPEYPAESQSDPKGRRSLLLGSLVAVPACLAVAFAYFVFSCGREVQEAIAGADRLDPGWGIQEVK